MEDGAASELNAQTATTMKSYFFFKNMREKIASAPVSDKERKNNYLGYFEALRSANKQPLVLICRKVDRV